MKNGFIASAVMFAVLGACGAQALAQDAGAGAIKVKVTLPAADAWEKGMGGAGVQRELKGGGITLYDTTLVEDDGFGAGSDADFLVDADRSPVVKLDANTWAKKILIVDRPQAFDARIFSNGGVVVEVNGTAVGKTNGDRIVHIASELLKKGENVVILRAPAEANAPFEVKVSARRHILQNSPQLATQPARSFLTTDCGQTWTPIDGELCCRLSLGQYAAQGSFISPVIDLAGGDANVTSFARAAFQGATLTAAADTPAGTSVDLLVRTGASPVYEEAAWTDWQTPKAATPKNHRFLQWQAVLKTADGKATPVLRSVTLEATAAAQPAPAWAGKVAAGDSHNEEIRYTSIPFEYENPTNPRAAALREKYKLDEVFKDGNTEFERFVALRNWVAKQWKYNPPEKNYPAWDADEILTRKIGFCVQYAITYVQCCTAIGQQARFVFGYHPGGIAGSGHEVTEVWSNQYRKWVFMDPQGNRHYVDPNTNVPLSMLEAHDRMVHTFYGDKPATSGNRPKSPRYSDEIMTCSGQEIVPAKLMTAADPPPKNWPAWSKWMNIRYAPRNNFYSQPTPLPRIQGWGGWEWPGFYAWYDAQTSRDWRYGHFMSRRSDLEWTINQVRFCASWGEQAGTLAVRMGTVTPNFQTFLVSTDGKNWQAAGSDYQWKLVPGKNRLEMRIRNIAGVEGPISFQEVEYK
jgi:hypothetical protein